MNPVFRNATKAEMFFGTSPIKASYGSAISTQDFTNKVAPAAANTTFMQPTSQPPLTHAAPLPQESFVLSEFLWQYRWEIGIGLVAITAGCLIYYYNEQEKKKKMGM